MKTGPIVCAKDPEGYEWFFIWSPSVDAPLTPAMTEKEIERYVVSNSVGPVLNGGPAVTRELVIEVKHQTGKARRSIQRARRNGVSICDYEKTTWRDYVRNNRAGSNESCLDPDELLRELVEARQEGTTA